MGNGLCNRVVYRPFKFIPKNDRTVGPGLVILPVEDSVRCMKAEYPDEPSLA